jgi:hypothetical protein
LRGFAMLETEEEKDVADALWAIGAAGSDDWQAPVRG